MNKPSVGDAHQVRTTDGVDALTDIFECDRRLSLAVRGLKRMRRLRTMQLCAYLLASLFLFSLARADEPKLVIVDNDFTGPPDTLSDLRSALMFLENPNFKVLGFTVVTGDGWRNEEVAHLLRLEEIVSRSDVPVIPGAVTPLVNTPQDKQAWEKRYPEKKVGTGEHGTLRKIGPGSPTILRTIQTSFLRFEKARRASIPQMNWHRNS